MAAPATGTAHRSHHRTAATRRRRVHVVMVMVTGKADGHEGGSGRRRGMLLAAAAAVLVLLLALGGEFPVPGLDPLLLHRHGTVHLIKGQGQGSVSQCPRSSLSDKAGSGTAATHIVQLVVESARIADGFPVVVPAPEGRGRGLAVGTRRARPPGRRQAALRLDQRPVLAVHLVVQSARVAQVVTGPVPTPQRRRRRPTVDTLASFLVSSDSSSSSDKEKERER